MIESWNCAKESFLVGFYKKLKLKFFYYYKDKLIIISNKKWIDMDDPIIIKEYKNQLLFS